MPESVDDDVDLKGAENSLVPCCSSMLMDMALQKPHTERILVMVHSQGTQHQSSLSKQEGLVLFESPLRRRLFQCSMGKGTNPKVNF